MGDENRVSRDRASRSRSKTPFLRSSCDRELCNSAGGLAHSGNHHYQVQYQNSFTAVAQSHNEEKKQTFSLKYSDTVFGTASVTGGAKLLRKRKPGSSESIVSQKKITNLHQINGVYRNSKERDSTSAIIKTVSRSLTDGRTSDYSSEEGENIHQEAHKAFQLYKDTGDWWNVFPKTDYTYSEYSRHRREIAPGIVNMPNMSRLGLRSQETSSPRHEYVQQSLKKIGTSNLERTRHSVTYARTASDLHDEKWARVLGTEYAVNQSIRQDNSFLHVTRTNITRIFSAVFSFLSCMIAWSNRSISSIWSDNYHPESKYASISTETLRAKLLQWIYRVLGYAKFVDTWLLMGWSSSDVSSHIYTRENRSQSLWSRLLKIFILLSPTLLLLGCWAYIQFCDDQEVSKSVSLPEPNEPLLTSNPKIVSGTVIQDFGTYSILKFLSGSFASTLHALWLWLLYPWVLYKQESKVMTTNTEIHVPFSTSDSTEKVKAIIEDCSSPKIDMDELASRIITNPLFVNLISATSSEPVDAKMKVEIENILTKINVLQQYNLDQKSQSALQLEAIKEMIKMEVAHSLVGLEKANRDGEERLLDKISKLGNDQQSQISQMKKLALDVEVFVAQAKHLENVMQEETSLRQNSIIGLTEDFLKLKEQCSAQSSSKISNEALLDHENWSFAESKMREIVAAALMMYDADKTGRADYALESAGGSIVNTRCTETFQSKTAALSLFGIHLRYIPSNPRSIIQPSVHPGECWAFKGSQGYVVIKLSNKVHINMFSLEHIPKALSPVGTIDSAPRNFSVWGLNDELDTEGQLIGQYMYDDNGSSLQSFPVEKTNLPPYQYVELRIESNHGNFEYTCVYRFRVHGVVHKGRDSDLIEN